MMIPNDLEVPEDSTVKSGELSHMMLILEQHNRIIYPDDNHFYWADSSTITVRGPFKSFLACLCDAVAPWHGENG